MSAYDEMVRLLLTDPLWRDPNPSRRRVTALVHATQAATRAELAGADDDLVVAALIHDAARPLSDVWHGEVVAYMTRGKLRDGLFEALFWHGRFQTDYLHGSDDTERFREESWYSDAVRLAGYDAASFDPDYATLPLDHFLPRLQNVMAR